MDLNLNGIHLTNVNGWAEVNIYSPISITICVGGNYQSLKIGFSDIRKPEDIETFLWQLKEQLQKMFSVPISETFLDKIRGRWNRGSQKFVLFKGDIQTTLSGN